jgi:predicted TIM-barrel fold metal-dependent hydrolase
MFPTFGCGVEEALKADIPATMASLRAFNLWLDEDWGFDRPDHRILTAPMISLADPEAAVAEVDAVIERGARLVHVRPAPVPGFPKPRSLGDPRHDPVWARLAEANVPVAFHLGDSGYLAIAAMWGGKDNFEGFGTVDPFDKIVVDDRAIHDSIASLIVHGVFRRHPKLRVASIENGSEWVHRLAKRLHKLANQYPQTFPNDPVDELREHVWVAPYYEEDVPALAERIGVDRILFGSDWPHGEGLENPTSYVKDLAGLDDRDIRKIMRDNATEFLGSPAASIA